MDNDEYNKLFHTLELNLVAFKPLMQCDQEVLKLVNAAIEAEREACANLCDEYIDSASDHESGTASDIQEAIRARGQG
jgi:hypothetical protein